MKEWIVLLFIGVTIYSKAGEKEKVLDIVITKIYEQYNNKYNDEILLIDSTKQFFFSSFTPLMLQAFHNDISLIYQISLEYKELNSVKKNVKEVVKVGKQKSIRLITDKKLLVEPEYLSEQDYWVNLRQAYGNFFCILQISDILIFRKKYAVIYYYYNIDSALGGGNLLFLEKIKCNWKILFNHPIEIK